MRFRRITRADFPQISAWLATPHVARWWCDDPSDAAVAAQYGPSVDGTDPTEVFLVLAQDEPIGLIQRYRLGDEDESLAELRAILRVDDDDWSIDYFIGAPDRVGRGTGTEMIRAFVADLRDAHPEARRVVVPVHRDNVASWRALEKAGFVHAADGDLPPDNPADSPHHVVMVLTPPSS